MQLAGVEDVYTSSSGSTRTTENTLKAAFAAIGNTYSFLTPNLWAETPLAASPLEVYAEEAAAGKRDTKCFITYSVNSTNVLNCILENKTN